MIEINNKIKEISGNRELKHMDLYIVGGYSDREDSKQNLKLVYELLINKYSVDYNRIKKYNTGKSYMLMINNGHIKVF